MYHKWRICVCYFIRPIILIRYWALEHVSSDGYESMLNQASDFNQDISAWTGPAANSSQSGIFDYATNFNYKFACSNNQITTCVCKRGYCYLTDGTFQNSVMNCLGESGSSTNGECSYYGYSTTNYGLMKDWDVSRVTNMDNTFESMMSFNGNITGWEHIKCHNYEGYVFRCLRV